MVVWVRMFESRPRLADFGNDVKAYLLALEEWTRFVELKILEVYRLRSDLKVFEENSALLIRDIAEKVIANVD